MKNKEKKNIKRYIALVVSTIFLLLIAMAVPMLIQNSIPQVIAVDITGSTLVDTLNCTGTLEAKSSKNLYIASGIMVDEVFVKNGQFVNVGDPLFSVNKETTVSLWISAAEKEAASENQVSELLSGLMKDYFSSAVGNIFSSFSEENKTEEDDAADELIVIIPDVITASSSGYVANLNIKNDTYADSSAPLLQICDTSAIFARCELSESFASSLREGLRCTVTGDAFKEEYTAEIVEISPIAKTAAGSNSSIECLVEIDFPDTSLKSGYTAQVEVELSRKNNAISLPYSAIHQDEEGEYVWELYGSRSYRRNVTTGAELKNCIEITSGLEAGSFVVTSSDGELREGHLVKIDSSR